jgi:hypothetical protein
VVRYPVKVILIIFFLIPLFSHAGNENDSGCSAHYGLYVCDPNTGISDEKIDYSTQNKFSFDTKIEKRDSLFETIPTDESMDQIDTEDAFKNIDSFRAYMKTLEDLDRTGNDGEFSVKKRILDSTDFGLDCRIVADSIYELPNSQYYDCALQRYF